MAKDPVDRGAHHIPVHSLVFEYSLQRRAASTRENPRRPPVQFTSRNRIFLGSWYALAFLLFASFLATTLRPGDFEEIYGAEYTDESEPHAGQWDAVLTCFFIDTVRDLSKIAHDPTQPLIAGQEYRELPSYHPSHPCAGWRLDQSRYVCVVRASSLLAFFLHFTFSGPLLWHFENNNTNDPSIELDLEEVKALVREMGFRLSVRLFFTP